MCLARHLSTQKPNAVDLSTKFHPGKSVRGRRELKYVQILSQNTQGLSLDKEEMILDLMQQQNIFAYSIQETWRIGNEISEKYGYYIIQHGSDFKSNEKGRASGGVAIILSPAAVRSWIAAGSCVMHFGNRILAVKLEMEDLKGKPVTVVLSTAYAPIGVAKENVRNAFATDMDHLMEAPKSNEVLLICIDANASMGSRTHAKDPVLGPYGIERVNSAGRSLHDHLNAKGMCSAATFFPKPIHGSWRHPRSKQLHQLDHLLISRSDLCRVRDAGIWNKITVESDHAPLQMKLRIARNLSKQTESKGKFINRELLRNPAIASLFRLKVLDHLGLNALDRPLGSQTCAASYSGLREAVIVAAKETLTNAERRRPGWFNENQMALTSAINSRNNAQREYNSKCKPGEPKPQPEYEVLQKSRKQLKLTVAAAKNSWMDGKIKGLGQGNKTPKAYWDCVNNIKAGFNGHSKKVSEQRFRNKNGDLCSNSVKNAKTVKDHFQKVYNIKSDLDPTVFDQVMQRPIRLDLES